MREDRLTNEELQRVLAEYLISQYGNKEMFLKEIDRKILIKEDLIMNKEVNEINIIKNYKMNKFGLFNERNDYDNIPREVNKTLPLDTGRDLEEQRIRFLQDPTNTLDIRSSAELKRDKQVILASIKRDINSIVYAYNINEEVQEQAILEAKRQGYVFRADTPLFMLQNIDLIKQSAQANIDSINFVPQNAWTRETTNFVIELAKTNDYILSRDSPKFLRSNIELIKQSIRLDKTSGINVIWKNLTPEELIEIENYIVENHLDYVISFNTPINFKRNADICISSAKHDSESVNYFDWKYLEKNPSEIERVYDALIQQNYVLNYYSPDNLRNNTRICLNSIKNDVDSEVIK